MIRLQFAILCVVFTSSLALADGDREAKVKADKQQFSGKENWLYNKIDEAYEIAAEQNKPIMAVLRCIPCEECVKLDDDVIENHETIAPLMDQFVRVRLTGTNGLDLKTFQYDTDQSFVIFFLNADRTVYGRFGTRSHRTEWVTDVSVEGMAEAMKGALALHRGYPANRKQLLAKSNAKTEFDTPEQFPTLKKKPGKLNWEGKDFAKGVVKNCIHCHEISEARMELYWSKKKAIPEQVLYPYPHPKSVGLVLDPKFRARVVKTTKDSAAEKAGLQTGDDILRIDGQPIISMADVQWVLHHLPAEGAVVSLTLRRNGKLLEQELKLDADWRKQDDTSWRTGHWILRRSMLGGMKLEPSESGGLRVQHVGNWGPFGVAKRAGVEKLDLVLSVDGDSDFERESDVFDYINKNKKSGDKINLELLRDGRKLTVAYPIK